MGLNESANIYATHTDIGDMVLRADTNKNLHLTSGNTNPAITIASTLTIISNNLNIAGNVGFGTSPNFKLDVLGNINANNIFASGNVGIRTTSPNF